MKIPFDIKYRPQIESGEYKVETREGLPVRIICWDRLAKKHNDDGLNLCVLVPDDDGEAVYYYHRSGKRWVPNDDFDLFIVTPEEELSEFEKVVKDRLWRTLEYSETFRKDENKWTRELAAELLSLARKDLIEERLTSDPRKTDLYKLGKADALKDLQENLANNDIYRVPEWLREVLVMAKENGKKELLKDLPRWKKCEHEMHTLTNLLIRSIDAMWIGAYVKEGQYYIPTNDLILKLPGFKEDESHE